MKRIVLCLLLTICIACNRGSNETPAVTIAEVSADAVTLEWDPIYHGRTYEITRVPPWSDFVQQMTTAQESFVDINVHAGGRYHYTVCAKLYQNIPGNCTFWIIVETPDE